MRSNTIDIDYEGVNLTVEYYVEPAQNGGRTDPSWDAYVTVEDVYVGQDLVSIFNVFTEAQLEILAKKVESELDQEEPAYDDDGYDPY